MSLPIAYAVKKRMAKGGMMTKQDYQSECHADCESPCAVHPQASGYEMHEGDAMRPNHMAMEQDDKMLDQHGDDEIGPEGRHMAEGGKAKPPHETWHGSKRVHGRSTHNDSPTGPSTETWNDKPHRELRDYGKEKHREKLAEMRSMPKPNLPMADGGDVDMDMVGRVMKKRQHMYSKGGQVANDDHAFEYEFEEPNQFDDLVKDDELESHYNAKNSGDMDGNEFDADHDDMVARVMMKRRKQHNPNPA